MRLVEPIIFHELGHFIHFSLRNGYNRFKDVHIFIKESYASYVGWHLGELYYARRVYFPTPGEDITNYQRQWWWRTDTGDASWYSPLFVDLIDNYDQSVEEYYLCNPDPIAIPNASSPGHFDGHTLIKEIATSCTNWSTVKAKLQQFIGPGVYSSNDLTTYMAPYEYWFANN